MNKKNLLSRFYFIFVGVIALSVNSYSQSVGAGDAIEFDGDDDYVTLPDVINNGDFTIEFWFKPSTNKWKGTLLDLTQIGGFGGGRKYFFIDAKKNKLRFFFESANDADVQVNVSKQFTSDEWYHIACVGGFNRTDRHKVYINGIEMASSGVNTNGKPNNLPPQIRLGKNQSNYIVQKFAFPGKMEEFRIWSDERTQTEIRDNLCKKLKGNEANLECYYVFDEATTAISGIKDFSGNAINGTMHNMSSSAIDLSSTPVGDDCSFVLNPVSGSGATLGSSYGDKFKVKGSSGSADALLIYRVDEFPNVVSPPGSQTQLSQVVYYGTKSMNSSGFTYGVEYNYNGHPGISIEEELKLAKRDHNADLTWEETNATLNVNANTLTLLGQTGTEFILGSVGSTNTLPIELLSFEAEVKNESHIELNWLTASEQNNDYFTIERSKNGMDWHQIDRIDGALNSSDILSYSTMDYYPLEGRSYYRLKQTDLDGQFSFSEVIAVNFEKDNLLLAYPNPTNGEITITGSKKSLENLRIFNAMGAEISNQVLFQRSGEEMIRIDLSDFKNGFYFINSESTTLKILKN